VVVVVCGLFGIGSYWFGCFGDVWLVGWLAVSEVLFYLSF